MVRKIKRGFRSWKGETINVGRMFPNIMAGILVGIEEIIFAISIGTLVFSGELSPYLPHGIGIALITILTYTIAIPLLV